MPTRRVFPPERKRPTDAKHAHDHSTFVPSRGLKDARIAAGLTRERLSALSGYSVGDIAQLEDSPETLRERIITARLSGVLGVEHDQIRGID
jgi:hypothetical protein